MISTGHSRILISITDREKIFPQQGSWRFLLLGCELVTGSDISEDGTALIWSYPQVEHKCVQNWLHLLRSGDSLTPVKKFGPWS